MVAIMSGGGLPLNTDALNLAKFLSATVPVADSGHIEFLYDDGSHDDIYGQFSYSQSGSLQDGVITQMTSSTATATGFNVSGLNIVAGYFVSEVLAKDNAGFRLGLFYLDDVAFGTPFADVIRLYDGNDYIAAGDGNDLLDGGDGADSLFGEGGDDLLIGGRGNDLIDGGTGVDTAVYSGAVSQYRIAHNVDGSVSITDLRAGSPDGTDTLRSVEFLQFSDGVISAPTSGTAHDLGLDGRADLVWRSADGQVRDWVLNGATLSSDTIVANVPTNWKVIGLGDVTGDGRADLIWRNGDTGEVRSWAMVGAINTADRTMVASVGADWSLQQVADFNGDGRADLAWRNAVTNEVRVWTMAGGGVVGADTSVATAPAGWSIVGSGDFDGDGRADLVLRAADGANRLWLMNGATVASDLAVAAVPTNWTMEAAADFTGDGKADLIWRSSTGQVHMWTMNGAALTADTTLSATMGSAWALQDAADFTGDGRADLVWRNADTGEVRLWTMGPAGIASDQKIAVVGSNYHVVNLLGG